MCDFGVLNLLRERLLGPSAGLHAVTCVDPQEKCQENNGDTYRAYEGDGVAVDETGKEDCDGLPQGHDDGEDGSTKLVDGVEDEELTTRRTDGEQHGMEGKRRVTHHEAHRLIERALLQQ